MKKKKVLSLVLSLVLMFSTFSLGITSFAVEDNSDIQSFIDECKNLLLYEPEHVLYTASADENVGNDTDFSSCRLILKSSKKPDKLNSVGIASGYRDYYIVQFKDEFDTIKAYEYYSNVKYIDVSVDEEIGTLTAIEPFEVIGTTQSLNASTEPKEIPVYDVVPDRLNSWGSEVTGAYTVKDYLIENPNLVKKDITVAVIDSGIEYDHEYFSNKQDRLERTYFTTITDKKEDEYDINGHGTAVTSVILDSTPDNVKVRNYKISDDGTMMVTDATAAVLQAVNDGVELINCSFTFVSFGKGVYWDMISDALKDAYTQGTLVVCSAGNYTNESLQPHVTVPSTSEYVLSVTGLGEDLRPTFSRGYCVDVSAPGRNMPVAYKSAYEYVNGTSFSSPLTVAICAEIISIYPSYTPEKLIDLIKETSTPYEKITNFTEAGNVYGTGFVDAIEATGIDRPNKVVPNIDEGQYEGEISLELSAPDGGEIYYCMSNIYPTKENGTLYTEPIRIYSDQFTVLAVTFDENGVPSKLFSEFYRSSILEDESNFEINENGMITKYNGSLADIIIPNTINSIEVKGILKSAFEDSEVTGIVLPDTVKTLGSFEYDFDTEEEYESYQVFYHNQNLYFIDGEGVEEIGHEVFNHCKRLTVANFPNCKKIGDGIFDGIISMPQIKLPKVEYVGVEAFFECRTHYLYLPELISCAEYAFRDGVFYYFYAPKFSHIDDTEIAYFPDILKNTEFNSVLDWCEAEYLRESLFSKDSKETILRIEFSKLRALYDLPGMWSSLVLPSTLKELPTDLSPYKNYSVYGNILPTYTVYGSAGTSVERWAKQNGINFIEITPETAVITDLPKFYKPYMRRLDADVVGFNREYQWYANDVNSNQGGTPIEGANDKFFDPATYPNAKYYYCVVTSTDTGFDPITIRTSACENRMFEKNEHNYVPVITYPTCTEKGYTTYTCTCGCGSSYIDEYVEPLGHNGENWSVTVPATCTENGEETLYCSTCNEIIETRERYANGHTEGEWTVTTPATCTENGEETLYCSVCKEVIDSRTIQPLEHSIVSDDAVAPNCTQTGLTAGSHCSICNEVITEQDIIPATGHTFGEWIVVNSATTEKDGLKERFCHCGEKEMCSIPVLVQERVASAKLNKNNVDTYYNRSFALALSIQTIGNPSYDVEYSSSNTDVAIVDNNGNVKTVGRGNATITATVTYSNGTVITDTCNVNVKFNFWQWLLYYICFGWIWM